MDVTEFRELFLQSLTVPARGRSFRLIVSRSETSFIVPRISEPAYLSLRSIPFEKNYRMIVSNFTHGEYEKFKLDFSGQLKFLRIPLENFLELVNILSEAGMKFAGFSAFGRGKMTVKPEKPGDTWALYSEMLEAINKGFRPYILDFSDAAGSLSVRSDFNIFCRTLGPARVDTIHLILSRLFSSCLGLYERLNQVRPETKASANSFSSFNILRLHFAEATDGGKMINSLRKLFSVDYVGGSIRGVRAVRSRKTGFPLFYIDMLSGSRNEGFVYPSPFCDIENLVVFNDMVKSVGGDLT